MLFWKMEYDRFEMTDLQKILHIKKDTGFSKHCQRKRIFKNLRTPGMKQVDLNIPNFLFLINDICDML